MINNIKYNFEAKYGDEFKKVVQKASYWTNLETDRLMSSHNNSKAQIILSNNFGQSGIFGIVESETLQLLGDLKTKGAHFRGALHDFVGNGSDLVVMEGVVFGFEKAGEGVDHGCEVFFVFFGKYVWVGEHMLGVNSSLELPFNQNIQNYEYTCMMPKANESVFASTWATLAVAARPRLETC